jgi:hypothetical protein
MTISTERSVKAYCLMHNTETMNSDLGYHAQVVPFEGYEQVSIAMNKPSETVNFPNPVEFQGLLSTVRQTDFPVIQERWPVMSKRMVEVLESVGSFPHRIRPARILDGRIGRSLAEGDRRFDEQGNFKPEFYTDDYILLQITEHLDAIDLERSVYRRYEPDVNMLSGVRKFVFKDIGREYPPIFRPTHCPARLFISDSAKQALEEASIKGLRLFDYVAMEYTLLS